MYNADIAGSLQRLHAVDEAAHRLDDAAIKGRVDWTGGDRTARVNAWPRLNPDGAFGLAAAITRPWT